MAKVNQKKLTKNDIQQKTNLLFDIDKTVFDFLNDKIGLYVIENNNKVKVPIKMVNKERWNQKKTDQHYHDKRKKLSLPLCTIKRDDITIKAEDYVLSNEDNMVTLTEHIPEENKYNDYFKKNNKSHKNLYVMQAEMPTPIEVLYTITLKTRYEKSMNMLLEQITLNKNKGRLITTNGFPLSWEIDSLSDDSNEDITDEIREFSYVFSLTVNTSIYSNKKNNKYNLIKKFTPHRVIINENIE